MKDCHMWWYFLHGKTHDLYGLLVLIAIGLALRDWVGVTIALISTGVFVDLWAHSFHH